MFGTTIKPATIVTTTVTMSAGFLVWLTRGGSLLMSVLSALPMWRLLDPLPVLESWDKRRKSAGRKKARDEVAEESDDQEQRVRSLIERGSG